jgi:hypothetical protein
MACMVTGSHVQNTAAAGIQHGHVSGLPICEYFGVVGPASDSEAWGQVVLVLPVRIVSVDLCKRDGNRRMKQRLHPT